MKAKKAIKSGTGKRGMMDPKASVHSSGDISERSTDIYLNIESYKGFPVDDWKSSGEELYSDLGF
jgi:hypothetical protein